MLATGGAVVVALEWGYRTHTSDVWLLLEAAVALAALLHAWREQQRLRWAPVLALALVFNVAWVALHLGLDVRGDVDSRGLYRRQGEALLDGRYPRSEYPVGAVLLFALEAWLGGGATRTANALLMIPFQVLTVAGVWATRTRYSAWLAAVVAFWPLNAFYWEFKFDLVPTALLVVGLALALRERWTLSGLALGLGAAVKWTPGLAALALLVWLAAAGRRRAAGSHALAFAAAVLIVHVPFLLWSPSEVWAAYSRQGGRTITPESLWYLPLHPLGLAELRTHISFSAGAPRWADVAATAIQALLVVAVLAASARARSSLRAGVAVAAMAPVVFLLTNRIFSAQFIVLLLAAWAFAGALVVGSARQQLAVGLAGIGASLGNAFVYPFALPHYVVTWQLASLTLFALALTATGFVLRRARLA